MTVSGDKAILVDATVPDSETDSIVINRDFSIKLQTGDRAEAYSVFLKELSDYARENRIEKAVVKASASIQQGGGKLSHLLSAELRGVTIAALSSVCSTETVAKSNLSRNFGDRSVQEYISDNSFWDENFTGDIKAGSKEAAFGIIARCRK
ncbi:hypothetical protein HGK82_22160 [Ochrobactrum sp. MT180101]|nr:hypothetical protein HGK82_22160 [Ochrobactrum sp. MT180101]